MRTPYLSRADTQASYPGWAPPNLGRAARPRGTGGEPGSAPATRIAAAD
jgi:hypothetical protein